MPVSEYGLCRCGCGQPTVIADRTRNVLGHVRGHPIPYVLGHGSRKPPLEIGQRFGRWTITGLAISRLLKSGSTELRYPVRCDCGTERTVARDLLASGKSKSCRCLDHELAIERARKMGTENAKHGMVGTPTYMSWQAMKTRCNYEKHPAWHRYGGRGIKVCGLWLGEHGFENFLAFMGGRPEGLTLDRMDNERGYSPGNCRWSTPTEQQHNRSDRR